MTLLEFFFLVTDHIEAVANAILVFAAYRWIRCQRKVTVTLSIGSFRVRRRDCDLPTLTAIVSRVFFEGGWLPDDIRKELLAITTPKVSDVEMFGRKDCGTPPPSKSPETAEVGRV